MVTIEKLKGGYTYQEGAYKQKEIITTTDELFRRLLLHLEGRAPSFEGDVFGDVKIFRTKGPKSLEKELVAIHNRLDRLEAANAVM